MKVADYKVPNGKLLKIKLNADDNVINSVTILGDFFLHPESTIEQIEMALIGTEIDIQKITDKIQSVLDRTHSILLGAQPNDIAKAIERAFQQ